MRMLVGIFGVALGASQLGCGVLDCHPKHEQYAIDEALSEADVMAVREKWGAEFEAEPMSRCERLCGYVYERDRGWVAGEPDECEYTLVAEDERDPAQPSGSVRCEGRGHEYYCE